MNAPCKDCEKRRLGCHSECEAYGEFAKERNKKNAEKLKRHRDAIIHKKVRK